MASPWVMFLSHGAEQMVTTMTVTIGTLDEAVQEFRQRAHTGDRASVLAVRPVSDTTIEIRYRCGFWVDEAFVPSADYIRRALAKAEGSAL